jgi:hypothetical protein
MGVGGQCHTPAHSSQERPSALTVQEAGWALGLILMGVENLAPTGDQTPDRPACSKLLIE